MINEVESLKIVVKNVKNTNTKFQFYSMNNFDFHILAKYKIKCMVEYFIVISIHTFGAGSIWLSIIRTIKKPCKYEAQLAIILNSQ